MGRLFIVGICILAVWANSHLVEGKKWALLVAGSNTYDNYRHQADVCHAFHIVHSHGIPKEQIVVMMFDDIAYNTNNPIKGNIINRPGGPNLYPGVNKDYVGMEVNANVFLKVLSGDADGVENLIGRKGKVIESGPDDTIFVFFADHGAAGLIAFPGDEKPLYAHRFSRTLKSMHDNNRYKKMAIYIEACESGSMFHNGLLPKDINIFATTAANSSESSYAFYYDEKRDTYLGDLYSISWMEDSDKENLDVETLHKQYELVKTRTTLSHVCEWGDLSLSGNDVGVFQGNAKTFSLNNDTQKPATFDAVKAGDAQLEILKMKKDEEGIRKFNRRRESIKKFFQELVTLVSDYDYQTLHDMPVYINDFECYESSVTAIMSQCKGMKLTNSYDALRNLRVVAHLCEMKTDVRYIERAIRTLSTMSSLC